MTLFTRRLVISSGVAVLLTTAAGCSSTAKGHITPAQLARLSPPVGFVRTSTCFPASEPAWRPYEACFSRRRSVLLTTSDMQGWVKGFGATAQYGAVPATPPVCDPRRYEAVSRLGLIACAVDAKLRGDHLIVTASSLVVAGPTSDRATAQTAPGVAGGTQIEVEDETELPPNA